MIATGAGRRELDFLTDRLISLLDRILAALEGLDDRGLNWRPTPEGTNSLYVIVTHTLGNAEENILEMLCGERVGRDRDAEFAAGGESAVELHERWQSLRERLRSCLAGLTPADMGREFEHPRRGVMTGREVMLITISHAAEHIGEAELTLNLYKAPPA